MCLEQPRGYCYVDGVKKGLSELRIAKVTIGSLSFASILQSFFALTTFWFEFDELREFWKYYPGYFSSSITRYRVVYTRVEIFHSNNFLTFHYFGAGLKVVLIDQIFIYHESLAESNSHARACNHFHVHVLRRLMLRERSRGAFIAAKLPFSRNNKVWQSTGAWLAEPEVALNHREFRVDSLRRFRDEKERIIRDIDEPVRRSSAIVLPAFSTPFSRIFENLYLVSQQRFYQPLPFHSI